MICPKCHNIHFEANEDIRRPLKNLGKEKYPTVDIRRYVCLQCGYVFKTKEIFYQEVNVRKNYIEAANVDR